MHQSTYPTRILLKHLSYNGYPPHTFLPHAITPCITFYVLSRVLGVLGLVFRLASLGWDLMAVVPDASSPRGLANDVGILAETSLGKGLPDETGVLSAGENLIGLNDRVSRIEERGSASERVSDHRNGSRIDGTHGCSFIPSTISWIAKVLPCFGTRGTFLPNASTDSSLVLV